MTRRIRYRLHFFHTHTGERLNIVYRNDEGYNQESLTRLNRYLRDHRTGEIHDYDPRLFDLLHDLTASLGSPDLEIDVICGTVRPGATNSFALMDTAWPITVSICRRWPLTFVCPGSPLHN